jgi:hypothetical protein
MKRVIMDTRLNKNQAQSLIERSKDHFTPNRFNQITRLAQSISDRDQCLPYQLLLDTLAESKIENLGLLRKARADIKKAFREAGFDLCIEVTKGKAKPADKVAWFSGQNLSKEILAGLSERSIGVTTTGIYDQEKYESPGGLSVQERIFVSNSNGSDTKTRDAIGQLIVHDLPSALKLNGRNDLAESIWYDRERTDNQMDEVIKRAIRGSELGLLLCSEPWMNSDYVREHELPSFDPQTKSTHGRRVIGIMFEPIKPFGNSHINDRLKLNQDQAGGIQWLRFDRDQKAYLDGSLKERKQWVRELALKISEKLPPLDPSQKPQRMLVEQRRQMEIDPRAPNYCEEIMVEPEAAPAVLTQRSQTEKTSHTIEGYNLLNHLIDWALDDNSS